MAKISARFSVTNTYAAGTCEGTCSLNVKYMANTAEPITSYASNRSEFINAINVNIDSIADFINGIGASGLGTTLPGNTTHYYSPFVGYHLNHLLNKNGNVDISSYEVLTQVRQGGNLIMQRVGNIRIESTLFGTSFVVQYPDNFPHQVNSYFTARNGQDFEIYEEIRRK